MQLLPQWRSLLQRAWSVRLGLTAAALSAAEVALPMFTDAFNRGTFATLSALVAAGAVIARVIAQPKTLPQEGP